MVINDFDLMRRAVVREGKEASLACTRAETQEEARERLEEGMTHVEEVTRPQPRRAPPFPAPHALALARPSSRAPIISDAAMTNTSTSTAPPRGPHYN